MTDMTEKQITESIAKTCRFTLGTTKAKCDICGKRFMLHYYGRSLNDRMLQHYQGHCK